MKNPYAYTEAVILNIVEETPNIKTFTVKPREAIPFKAGQFMDLTVIGKGEAPFTPSSNHNVKETLDFTIMKAGRITGALHRMKIGDAIGVRGPYGLGYPLDRFRSKEIFIVGGGVGLAPLRALLYALFNDANGYKKIILKYGARTSKDIVYKREMESWKKKAKHVHVDVTVDIGDETWKGNVGLVTAILKKQSLDMDNAVSIVCGPPIMMKFVIFKLLGLGFKDANIHLSMEKNMSCGIGKCGHCRIGPFYACKDGPVFTYDKVKHLPHIWD